MMHKEKKARIEIRAFFLEPTQQFLLNRKTPSLGLIGNDSPVTSQICSCILALDRLQ